MVADASLWDIVYFAVALGNMILLAVLRHMAP